MSLRPLKSLVAGLSLLACTSVFAAPLETYNFEFTDIFSNGLAGNATNEVYPIFVGANASITRISYTVNLTAFAQSYLSQIGLQFTSTDGFGLAILPAGSEQNFAGTATYSADVDLLAGGQAFNVGSDGLLRLEFFETLDDFAGADGAWNVGVISFGVQEAAADVPEPATGMLMGAGLLVMGYAARRRRARSAAV